jgi:hypothetical protein
VAEEIQSNSESDGVSENISIIAELLEVTEPIPKNAHEIFKELKKRDDENSGEGPKKGRSLKWKMLGGKSEEKEGK